jgi:hypothetical protein
MELLEVHNPILAIVNEFGEEQARWQRGRDFLVTAAMAMCSQLDEMVLVLGAHRDGTGGRVAGQFKIQGPHVMGAFSGDTVTFDDAMDAQVADGIHTLIEGGALLSPVSGDVSPSETGEAGTVGGGDAAGASSVREGHAAA